MAARIPAGAWRHLSAGQGRQGRTPLRPGPGWPSGRCASPARGHWLRVRRSLADGELAYYLYYLCYGPADTSLAELVQVTGLRWTVECGFQQGKVETGLGHHQVRRYQAWYRHVTLSMLAQAFLAVQRARAAVGTGAAERAELAEPLVALSVPEVRRLWCLLVWSPPAEPARALGWWRRRRRHQARARRSHWQRRQRWRKVRP